MTRAEYLRLVAEITERWPAGRWSDEMIDKWWPMYEALDVVDAVRGVQALQRDGHGPFTPDPGTVLRHARAAQPGGGRYRVGAHAAALPEMAETASTPKRASEAISACRALLAASRHSSSEIAPENGTQAP